MPGGSDGIRIGLSGWSYPHWRSGFYKGIPQRLWLQHCASHFNTIEVNATFYRLLNPSIYARWRAATPDGFAFAIKGSRAVTHARQLREPADRIVAQRDNSAGLGDKLHIVLWQLPDRLHNDIDRLARFADDLAMWSNARHAIEFRHRSWFDTETATLLAGRKIAICQSDAADWPRWNEVSTDFVYVRLHGAPRTYYSRYSDDALEDWARRISAWRAEGRSVYVYFDNDADGHAPRDALRLMGFLGLERPRANDDTVR
jgi:uncharacterized protein YecE (DUF72 family)